MVVFANFLGCSTKSFNIIFWRNLCSSGKFGFKPGYYLKSYAPEKINHFTLYRTCATEYRADYSVLHLLSRLIILVIFSWLLNNLNIKLLFKFFKCKTNAVTKIDHRFPKIIQKMRNWPQSILVHQQRLKPYSV